VREGILSNFVLVPMIWFIGTRLGSTVYPSSIPISNMSAGQIFRDYVRFVGVGAIAAAGIFGIAKSLRSVVGRVLPAIYGCNGLVDIETAEQVVAAN
jgi:hypothetical protein